MNAIDDQNQNVAFLFIFYPQASNALLFSWYQHRDTLKSETLEASICYTPEVLLSKD